ncbi:heterokaryon incompatibility protein-domain-containing protein [Halenospora varia]|nr:heterokaryon incompatibility protein-domain-containing protein [Halenospora varia]
MKQKKSKHEQGLIMESLPKTFLHAFQVAAQLGVRYIWIDSIYIIQDSKEDWEVELAKMGRVYSNAVFTIAGESATDCQGGLWLDCNQRPSGKVNHVAPHGTPGVENLSISPLQKRAWTLQERELSPRIIDFTHRKILWQCKRTRINPENEKYNQGGWKGCRYREFDKPSTNWKYGTVADRLPALSGLANELELLTKCEYVARLWRTDILMRFLWEVQLPIKDVFDNIGIDNRKASSLEIAPSWSWASCP